MRIWFNQWFSTAYHLIDLMWAGSPGKFTFVGSSANPNALYRLVSDEWYTEPVLPVSEEYVEYCLEFCKAHQIDIFFPRRALTLLSRYREEFLAAGTKLAVGSDYKIMRLLDDKAATYAFFEARDASLVPAHLIAGTYEEFCAAYETLRPHCRRVCYKLTRDEGAETFRVIDDTLLRSGDVRRKPGMGGGVPVTAHPRAGVARTRTPARFRQRTAGVGLKVDVTDVAETLELLDQYDAEGTR